MLKSAYLLFEYIILNLISVYLIPKQVFSFVVIFVIGFRCIVLYVCTEGITCLWSPNSLICVNTAELTQLNLQICPMGFSNNIVIRNLVKHFTKINNLLSQNDDSFIHFNPFSQFELYNYLNIPNHKLPLLR